MIVAPAEVVCGDDDGKSAKKREQLTLSLVPQSPDVETIVRPRAAILASSVSVRVSSAASAVASGSPKLRLHTRGGDGSSETSAAQSSSHLSKL